MKKMITKEQKARIQEEFRIPVDSSWPGTYWINSLSQDSEMPTDVELAMIRSHCEFVVRNFYNETYIRKILVERDLPADAGHNTTIFRCNIAGKWCYRRTTWESGWSPHISNSMGVSLLEVMDSERSFAKEINPKWVIWKAEHPDIFNAKS